MTDLIGLSNPAARVSIKVLYEWDAKLLRTESFTPRQSASVLLDWTCDPPLEEEGLPKELAAALAKALLEHGTVAGRWFDDGPVPEETTLHTARSGNLIERAANRIRNLQPEPVITTRSLAAVCELFDRGWGVQQQALLILDSSNPAPFEDVLKTLSTVWDWTAFTFPPPVRALIAPGNDGDYILVTAATAAHLTPLLDSILHSFHASGFAVQA